MPRTHDIDLQAGERSPDYDEGSILFVGTATTVIRYAGFTLLTDPNFLHAGDHAHLGYGMRSRRLTNPAVEIDDLPPLDACLLSHLHGDHWDEVAARRLPKGLPILTTPHAARGLRRQGFTRTVALDTWDAAELRKGDARLRVSAMPARHGPAVASALLPPVMGSMLEWSRAGQRPVFRAYVSGDTLVHEDLRRIPERYPQVDLGLFHLGGARVLGVLVTLDAAQGVEAIRIIRPEVVIPIHYGDYPVFKSPLSDFMRAARAAELPCVVEYLARGETWRFRVPAAALGRPRAAGPAIRPEERQGAQGPRAEGPGRHLH
ncbi:MBL fold metallo-hydrolase [Anaeromyxobacter paludicola]|uniref:Metallo-beta-lactamase domain-containing protein n=1 Tax=Anaeromyxobacter paludicola TaxID=2918171 RepID=A0ABM7XE82_9BACT|nr:MBL fold metallo-hydrolase [Anaeromyxobacter paludicola]BDG10187.1 hypothetical protein AMPC_33000 [Anaeromyxobacter paludicola]